MLEADGPKNPGRRRFLQLGMAAAGVAASGWAASSAYENRTFGPDFDISPQFAELLKKKSKKVVPHIKAGNFDPVKIKDTAYQPSVNIDAMATALTYLSFLDGGMSEVDEVFKYVISAGLEINQMEPERRKTLDGAVIPPIQEGDPIILEINPRILPDFNGDTNTASFHELYHIVQRGRRNNAMRDAVDFGYYIKNTTAAIHPPLLAISVGATTAEIQYKNGPRTSLVTRRGLLAGATGIAAAAPSYLVGKKMSNYVDRFHPEEWQAHRQAGPADSSPGVLTSKTCFDELRGKMFLYDKIA